VKRIGVAGPEEMTQSGRDGIGDIRPPWRAPSAQEPGDHGFDLFLFRAAAARHGFLDGRRSVFEHPQPRNPQCRENDSASVGELQRRARADAVKRRLDGGLRGSVLRDDGQDLRVQAREALRERQRLGEPEFATGDELRLVGRTGDDGPPGASGSRVNAQDSAGDRQDAASETASSSKERLAYTF
jgi:hypothetical protein